MFRGDDVSLRRTMHRAASAARRLGQSRVGSEHLLLALVCDSGPMSTVWAAHTVTAGAVLEAVVAAAPLGAGASADRDMLSLLGISVDQLFTAFGAAMLDRPPMKEPVFPLGGRQARERCARSLPPLGLDAQAAYEASLRLAISRGERQHQPEHLALTLVALDPGVAWVLASIGTDAPRVLSDLLDAFPPLRRNRLARPGGSVARRSNDRIVGRYQHTSGRAPISATGALRLLGG